MVHLRQHIPRMENKQIFVVDSQQLYATLTCSTFMFVNSFTDSAVGVGKSILWYVAFCMLPQ